MRTNPVTTADQGKFSIGKDFSPWKPFARIGDRITNSPELIVEKKIIAAANFSALGLQHIIMKLVNEGSHKPTSFCINQMAKKTIFNLQP